MGRVKSYNTRKGPVPERSGHRVETWRCWQRPCFLFIFSAEDHRDTYC